MSGGYQDITRPRRDKAAATPQPIQWQAVVVPRPAYESLAQKMFYESAENQRQPGEGLPEWAERVRVAAEAAGIVGAQPGPHEEPLRVPTPPARQARLPYVDRQPGEDDE